MAPVNVLMYAGSKVPTTPFIDPAASFPELLPLREHWREIRDEALALREQQRIRAADGYNDVGFNSFFRRGWKRFYLKWYASAHPSAAELCPRTTALLAAIPSVKAAMFAELPPGSELRPHRDPYAGSLRCTWAWKHRTTHAASSTWTASATPGTTANGRCSTKPTCITPATTPPTTGSSCSATWSGR
jgi:aspartyl/asparaginyl beta-hydroxylase (cupin superfamily)